MWAYGSMKLYFWFLRLLALITNLQPLCNGPHDYRHKLDSLSLSLSLSLSSSANRETFKIATMYTHAQRPPPSHSHPRTRECARTDTPPQNDNNILYSPQREIKAVVRSYTSTHNEELNSTKFIEICAVQFFVVR